MSNTNQTTMHLYVATNGNDAWTGAPPEPNAAGTDGPFATLRRARDTVRGMRDADGKLPGPVKVRVRGGKYYLDETLVLGAEDSGTADCPVTWEAYPGETPVLSGGVVITGWRPYQGRILQAELPGAKGGKWRFRQLFFNGQRQIRSRYPKLDPANPIYGGWLFTKGMGSTVTFGYDGQPAPEPVASGGPLPVPSRVASEAREADARHGAAPDALTRRWKKPTEAEVYMYTGIANTIPIKAIDEENRVITLARATKDFKRLPYARFPVHIGENAPFYVENILEELSQPGEWCLDGEDGVLYFWPPAPMEWAEVVVPVLDCLIDLNGASWITASGFIFTETTYGGDNMHREGNEGYGAFSPGAGGGREYCGEALHMSGAEHCRIENNRFYAVGGNAIYVEGRNTRNIIGNNEISHAGANGVCLIGTRYFQSLMVGPLRSVRLYPIYNQVEHNHVHHCGVFDQCIAGVFLGLSDSNVIGHNLIEHMPHHGINLGNSQYGRNIVEYNEIRHTCLRTSDNGAINVWGEDPEGHIQKDVERSGHVIRYNLIADTHGWHVNDKGVLAPSVWLKEATEAATHGIYLDNFASNCFVCGNILVRSGSTGVYIQGGKNNIVENNIVVDVGNLSHLGGWWQPQMGEPSFMTGNRFCRNIFYRTHGNPPVIFRHIGYKTEPLSDAIGLSDYNLFFSQVSEAFTITESTSFLFPELPTEWPKIKVIRLEEWQKEGFDTHSLIADPLFVDAAHDDYRLRPDSPAYELGFQPIPVEGIGIRGADAIH